MKNEQVEVHSVNMLLGGGYSSARNYTYSISEPRFDVVAKNLSRKAKEFSLYDNGGRLFATKKCPPGKTVVFRLKGLNFAHCTLRQRDLK